MNKGFLTVASAIPAVEVGDCNANVSQIISSIRQAENQGCDIIVFPELSVTGYTCQDLFRQTLLLNAAETAVADLLAITVGMKILAVVGVPVSVDDKLLNCAAVLQDGKLLALVVKTYLPNYAEFYEQRWFSSAADLSDVEIIYAGNKVLITNKPQVFVGSNGVKVGIELCEDVWAPVPPSDYLALLGTEVVLNLSASDDLIGKHKYLIDLLSQQSARTMSAYVYSSCGFGESTQDVVFGGNAFIFENGVLLARSKRFSVTSQFVTAQIDLERLRGERRQNTTFSHAATRAKTLYPEVVEVPFVIEEECMGWTLTRYIEPYPFIPSEKKMEESCEEIFNIQVMGLAKRLVHTHCRKVVIGISGGLDSTLALLVCVKTFDKLNLDRKGIVGVTMPGFGTTDRTYRNACALMEQLGITRLEIPISNSVLQHFKDIGHDVNVHDVFYENSQARERTQILMDLSNKVGGLVIGTGDLSELALGWATYNGDHMSMYAVNASIPKTLVKYLVSFVARTGVDEQSKNTLDDIIATPISPELIPADSKGNILQKTEDLVGPYALHDFFLYYFLRFGFRPSRIFLLAERAFEGIFDKDTIKYWLTVFFRRFFSQQFKRSCLPDGPKVGSVSLSPRGDWRMPSDASSSLWLAECERL